MSNWAFFWARIAHAVDNLELRLVQTMQATLSMQRDINVLKAQVAAMQKAKSNPTPEKTEA